MPLSSLLLTLTLSSSASAPPQETTSALPSPLRLKREELLAGDPLAPYVEQVRQEAAYAVDPKWKSGYWQTRAMTANELGDVEEAAKSWNLGIPVDPSPNVFRKSPIEGMRPESAVDVLLRAADRHRWIMLGEEHVSSRTRSLLIPLLRGLYRKGFRTFAAETFNVDVAERTRRDGYPSYAIGTYTADPVFAAGVREAIRLGFRLVPYEAEERPTEIPADDPQFAQNFRENLQAKNLKTRIFDRDPKAKVLVWAGRAHVQETAEKDPDWGEWRPMAYEFKRMTGVDPFTAYLALYIENSERRFEAPVYKWATDRGLVTRPTIFVGANGRPFGDVFDAQVFFPRTVLRRGRPDWLEREWERRPIEIPPALIEGTGLQLAQAFAVGEPITAIPIDQILIRPSDPVPVLLLPKGDRYRVRVLRADGRASAWASL